jgi:hypothetical protein
MLGPDEVRIETPEQIDLALARTPAAHTPA